MRLRRGGWGFCFRFLDKQLLLSSMHIAFKTELPRHFHGCVKIHLTLRAFWSNRTMSRQWWSYAIFAHTLKMKRHGSFDSPKGTIDRLSGRNTPG